MNTVTILGGAAAGVGTGQGCSSYLVRNESTTLVLDLGMNTLHELRKHTDYRTLDAIVISHLHMDHVLDLFALRFMCNYNPVKPPQPLPLFLPPGGKAFMENGAALWADPTESKPYFDCYDMVEYDPDQPLTIGDYTLTFARTAHPVPCWAIRVHPCACTGDFLYTADSGSAADLDPIALGAELIAVDGAAPVDADPEAVKGVHYTPQQAASLCERARARHMILTHLWEENGVDRALAAAREHYSGPITLAKPGTVVTW